MHKSKYIRWLEKEIEEGRINPFSLDMARIPGKVLRELVRTDSEGACTQAFGEVVAYLLMWREIVRTGADPKKYPLDKLTDIIPRENFVRILKTFMMVVTLEQLQRNLQLTYEVDDPLALEPQITIHCSEEWGRFLER